jgi:hypothetical protein
MGYAKRVVNLIKEFFIKRISKDAIKWKNDKIVINLLVGVI